MRRQLLRFRGREIDTAGDGFFATFDGPARAIRCACAITDGVRELGLSIRAGLHTGECEIADSNVAGIAVHTGARVAAQAGADEVLVSNTVKDLVAGSGIEFIDRGAHELKGIQASGDYSRSTAERRCRRWEQGTQLLARCQSGWIVPITRRRAGPTGWLGNLSKMALPGWMAFRLRRDTVMSRYARSSSWIHRPISGCAMAGIWCSDC